MKEIKAFIRPSEFNDVFGSLRNDGYCCVTVTDTEGTGRYSDPGELEYPSSKIPYMHSKMLKLEIISQDKDVNNIVEIIKKHGRTGVRGDGIICVIDVERSIHIRTGEEGEEILNMSK
ncbi:MAG: P-II family nitrogen regulator [Ignavibacteriae bacterium]|nr:P-II family nitrogen regulator [Ignavibacteriota bacterium]